MERLRSIFLCTSLHCGGCREPPKSICGIGAVLEPNELGELEVADLIPGGSAEASGLLQIGDILHEVDGLDMYKMPAKEVGEFIRGESGTTVSLGIAKKSCRTAGTVYIETIEIVRAETKLPEKPRQRKTIWEKNNTQVSTGLLGTEFAGIGVGLTPNEDEDLEVSEVIPGGPAEACGQIDVGDVLLEVDGINVEGKKLQEVAPMIRGEAGTTVCLALAKSGDIETIVYPVIIRDNKGTLMDRDKKWNMIVPTPRNNDPFSSKTAFVSLDSLDIQISEPDLKHRGSLPAFSTTVCITLTPR